MQTDVPILFVEINYVNYIFVAGKYNNSQDLKIIEKINNLKIFNTKKTDTLT